MRVQKAQSGYDERLAEIKRHIAAVSEHIAALTDGSATTENPSPAPTQTSYEQPARSIIDVIRRSHA